MKLKRLLLILWIVFTIFPLAIIGRFSAPFMRGFNSIFGPVWVHVVMHAALFCGLILLLLVGLRLRPGWRAVGAAILAIFVVAALQEGLQALSQGVFYLSGSLEDLAVDLLGGAIGYGFYCAVVKIRRKQGLTAV